MKYTRALSLLILLTVVLLAGCGQKGPLYLPGSEPAPTATTDTTNQSDVPGAPSEFNEPVAPDASNIEP